MAFVGPFTLVTRVIARLNSIGWTRAAGNLAFTTLLGLVPIATLAFALVAQFPVFQDFIRVLENYLIRYMLPQDASAIVQKYVVGLATEAANLKGLWILFVVVTAVLVVDTVESEINAIWDIRRKRPLLRRIVLYTIGVTAGPVLVGAAIMLIRWLLAHWIAVVSLNEGGVATLRVVVPFVITVAFFTLLYEIAPARACRAGHAFVGGILAAAAFEAAKYGFAWYVAHLADLRDPLRRAGGAAAVPALDLCVLDDRAGGRRGHGDADRASRAGAKCGVQRDGVDATMPDRRVLLPNFGPATLHCGVLCVRSAHFVWSIIQAAGWPIWPLIFASIIALALIFERLWSLRQSVVAPPGSVDRVLAEYRQTGATPELLAQDRAARAARPHPRRRPCQRQEPAPGDEGGDRGGGSRRRRTISSAS